MSDEETEQSLTGKMEKGKKVSTYLLLHGILLLYSIAAICSKKAALSTLFSFEFFAWYFGVLVILVVYAFVWQQVLKRLSLFTAFVNKGIAIIWGILWGMMFFGESLSVAMLIGAALVFVGILMVVSSNAK